MSSEITPPADQPGPDEAAISAPSAPGSTSAGADPGQAPPPGAPAQMAPPPPPPPPQSFDAMAGARAALSVFDPTGIRPTAIVAGVILALFLGAQIVNALIPVRGAGPGLPGPGSLLTVGPLRIPLESGWVVQEVPESNIIARLAKGSAALDVFARTYSTQIEPAVVFNDYMKILDGGSIGFAASPPNVVRIGNGIPAARGSYTGVFGAHQVEGEVTTLVTGGQGWILDVWADSGTLRQLLPEAENMIDNIQVVQ